MKKGLFAVNKFYDENGELNITDEGVEDLYDLADIVIAKHFYSNSELEKEDLKSVGVAKAIELLNGGTFDPERSSLKNYCYTGMRNEMKNYLYRQEKEVSVDDEILATNPDPFSMDQLSVSKEVFQISRREIRRFLGRRDYEEQLVANALIIMGFQVEGGYQKVDIQDINQERVAMIQCQVIWSHLERYLY